MFVTASQIFVFIACVAFGGASGVILSISQLFKSFTRIWVLKVIFDFIAFLLISTLYILYANFMCFPNFRLYMAVGVLAGIFIYFKSFHILLAKLAKKLYTITIKIFKGRNQRWMNQELKD